MGLEYTKNKYVEKVQEEKDPRKESGAGGSSLPPVVNRCEPEKVAPPEIAKSLRSMFETGNFVDLHRPKKVNPLEEYSSEGGVFENEPEVREDLIRSGDSDEVEMDTTRLKKSGMTKNLLSKWEVPKDEPKKPSKGGKKKDMVEVAEDEGSIAENKPKKRENVVRGEDTNPTEVLPGKGSAKKAKAKLTTKKEKTKDSQQVKLTESEGAPTVFENEPEDHGDVAREHDDHEQLEFEKGRIKNLTGFFLAQTDDVKVVKKKIIIERDTEPTVLENEPEIRPDVIRSDDISDVDKAIQFEAGRTKNMASFWKTKHDEEESEASKLPKKPVKLDIAKDGASVSENQPQVRPDVIRHDDKEEYIVTGPGHAKNIASRFLKQKDDQEKKPKEKIKLERSEGPCIIENQPVEVQGDIVRATQPGEQVVLESGRTRNLLQHWIATEEDASRPKTSTEAVEQGSKPRWVMEIESARVDKSVYENEPESPDDDIVRAIDEDHSVVVPEKHTKGMANMWKKRQEEEEERERLKRTPQELVRFTPPREKTPPPGQERQQKEEYQRVTLSQPYPEDPPPPQQRRKKKGPQQQRRQQVPADSQTQAHGGQPHSQVVQQPAPEPTHPQPHGGQQPRTRAQQQRMRGQQQQQQQQQHAAQGPKTPVKSQATISLLRK